MKLIPLTRGFSAMVDDEDFELVSGFKWYPDGLTRKRCTVYAISGTHPCVKMHRLIIGAKEWQFVDHIDRNGLNNQKSNLRVCDRSQNQWNGKKRKNNRSGFMGVCWNKNAKMWVSQICSHNKRFHLGYFRNAVDAAKARDNRAKELFGEFAVLNFPCQTAS